MNFVHYCVKQIIWLPLFCQGLVLPLMTLLFYHTCILGRVCNIRPLFQIRIFGYFSRQIRISGFYPDFLVQVRIGPYIPFSNCKWHRRCRPTDENWNVVMPKRLRDDVMCFRLQIHSQWMMKTHWRAQSQRTHSVRTQEVGHGLRGLNRWTRDKSHYE